MPAADVIQQAARRRDHDIGPAIDLAVLVIERHSPDKEGHRQPVMLAQGFESILNLRCKFPRRFKNEGARHAGAGPALFHQS